MKKGLIKGLGFILCMVACGVVWANDFDYEGQMEFFHKLGVYDLCYEMEWADRTDDKVSFSMGLLELAMRGIEANDPDCIVGRSDSYEDFLREEFINE